MTSTTEITTKRIEVGSRSVHVFVGDGNRETELHGASKWVVILYTVALPIILPMVALIAIGTTIGLTIAGR